MGYASTTQFTYDLGAVMRRFGQEYHLAGRETSTRWRIGYVTRLIARHGFPAPLPYAGELPVVVRARSRWTVSSVDKWFEDRDPDGTAAADARDARAAAGDMDARAATLGQAIGRAVTGPSAPAGALAAALAAGAVNRGLRIVDGGAAA